MSGQTDTLIVSDIHLGLPISRPRDLLHLLEAQRFNRLILLGDVFHDYCLRHLCTDTWRLLRHIQMLSADRQAEVVWISGNHDRHLAPVIAKVLGIEVRESFTWRYHGRAYHALHGDCFDSFVSNYARLSDLFSRLYAFSIRCLSRHGEWPRRLDRLHLRMMALGEEVAAGARAFAGANPYDVIVCGHTHEPQHRLFDITGPGGQGIEYFNTGTWLDRPASFLSIGPQGVSIDQCP